MKKHIFIFILIFASLFLYGHPKPTQLPMVISHETVRAESARTVSCEIAYGNFT